VTTPERGHGFTLIEVLVALAIIAFGLAAVFGQMNQSATAAARLRDKTLAEWVGLNAITELRLSGEYPGVGTRSDEVELADVRWRFEVAISETEGNYMRRADVSVSRADAPDRPVTTVVGFIPQPRPAFVGGSGWGLPGAAGGAADEDGAAGDGRGGDQPPANPPGGDPAPPAAPEPPAEQ